MTDEAAAAGRHDGGSRPARAALVRTVVGGLAVLAIGVLGLTNGLTVLFMGLVVAAALAWHLLSGRHGSALRSLARRGVRR